MLFQAILCTSSPHLDLSDDCGLVHFGFEARLAILNYGRCDRQSASCAEPFYNSFEFQMFSIENTLCVCVCVCEIPDKVVADERSHRVQIAELARLVCKGLDVDGIVLGVEWSLRVHGQVGEHARRQEVQVRAVADEDTRVADLDLGLGRRRRCTLVLCRVVFVLAEEACSRAAVLVVVGSRCRSCCHLALLVALVELTLVVVMLLQVQVSIEVGVQALGGYLLVLLLLLLLMLLLLLLLTRLARAGQYARALGRELLHLTLVVEDVLARTGARYCCCCCC